jgi:hypothetical protein
MEGINLVQPDGWNDLSMIVYSSREKTGSGVAPNIVITQQDYADVPVAGAGSRIERFAEKLLADIRTKLPEAFVHVRRRQLVAGLPAANVIVSWLSGSQRLIQSVTCIERNASHVVIATSTAAAHEMEYFKQQFEEILRTLSITR